MKKARADMETAHFVAHAFKHGFPLEPTGAQKLAVLEALEAKIEVPDEGPPVVTGLFSEVVVKLALSYVASGEMRDNFYYWSHGQRGGWVSPEAREALEKWAPVIAGKYQNAHELLVDSTLSPGV